MEKPVLKYYCFDWDNNILFMKTELNMEHLVDGKWVIESVSTEKFSKIRKDGENWRKIETSYDEFGDFGKRGKKAFIEDVIDAIKNKKIGPSWNNFIECLINGYIFSIITARGHEPSVIRKAVKYIIFKVLTDEERIKMLSNLIKYNTLFNIEIKSEKIIEYYLNSCKFIGVSSPSFNKKYNTIKDGVLCPEEAKVIALNNFINKINKYGEIVNGDVNIGFSDDDPSNVNSVIKHFGEISELYKNISFNVIDTSDPNIIGGIKKRI